MTNMPAKVFNAANVFIKLLKGAWQVLSVNDPLRMAAATAFFTTFALPPILIIIIKLFGFIFERNIGRKIFDNLSVTIGKPSTDQVRETLRAVRTMSGDGYVTVIVFVILFFIATNLFKIIKDSINQIWKIKIVTKQNIWIKLRGRWQGFILIMITGILFSVAIITEGAQAYVGELMDGKLPGLTGYLQNIFNYIFSVIIVTAWFAILFKFLPDGKHAWKTVIAGALFTGVLFNSGKLVLRLLLVNSNLNNLYGASASVILLLLFVFYSSLILYFGAAFTKVWADFNDNHIRLKAGAVRYRWSEIPE